MLGLIAEAVTFNDHASLGLNNAIPIADALTAIRVELGSKVDDKP
ncbi:hypothetical protein CCP1ISM_4210001 [Azospirillaceae bacterium]